MAESFLKEQLERIRRMTERMSALESSAAELSDVMAHDRAAMRQGAFAPGPDYRSTRIPSCCSGQCRPGRRKRHPSAAAC